LDTRAGGHAPELERPQIEIFIARSSEGRDRDSSAPAARRPTKFRLRKWRVFVRDDVRAPPETSRVTTLRVDLVVACAPLKASPSVVFNPLQVRFTMLKLRLSAFAFLIGLNIVGCSAAPSDNGTGGRAGSGGSTSTGGTGGSTGACTGGSGGSGAGTTGDSGCQKFDYTNYSPTMSPTLKNDIQPIFGISCALSSSCHLVGSIHHPHLGPSAFSLDGGKASDAELQAILAELPKASAEVAGRNVVVSGKPEDSYLMNKIEGTNNCSGFTCMGPDMCGIRMPDPSTPLEKCQIELIRAWIKKGLPM